jgi:hypothetical protein
MQTPSYGWRAIEVKFKAMFIIYQDGTCLCNPPLRIVPRAVTYESDDGDWFTTFHHSSKQHIQLANKHKSQLSK